MQSVTQYLLTVTAAAILCAIVLRLLDGKGSAEAMGKLLTGIYMALTVISPFAQARISDFGNFLPEITIDAENLVTEGKMSAQNALAKSISQRLEAYILDKAAGMDVTLTVEIELTEDTIPLPKYIHLHGDVSPFAKSRLQRIICDDLGIDKENQLWT